MVCVGSASSCGRPHYWLPTLAPPRRALRTWNPLLRSLASIRLSCTLWIDGPLCLWNRFPPLVLVALSSLDGWVGWLFSFSVHLFSSLSSLLRLLSSHHWGCDVHGFLGRFFFSLYMFTRFDPHLSAVCVGLSVRVGVRASVVHGPATRGTGLIRFSGSDTLPSFDRSSASAPGNAAPFLRAATAVT